MMRSGLGLCALGLLCLHSAVFGQDAVESLNGVLIFCDDPSVERAVHSAVHKFNERLSSGHLLALYQMLSASKSETGSDSVYSLEFTTRRSDCLAGSNKPWTDCDYLPYGQEKPFACNATVHMTETDADTTQVDCQLDNFIMPERASCLGCPVDIDENSEDLKGPLSASITKYNSISNSTHLFSLHTVGHATRQVVAGFRFKLSFDMKKTVCAKAEHSDLSELCAHDDNNLEFANCNSTVDVAPWRLEPPTAHIECEGGPMPPSVLRRRPPGWSPLRHLEYPGSTTQPPVVSTPPAPSKAANAKEESSEEDTKAIKPSASADAVNNNPFHCPSKPWKQFNPIYPAGPMKDATEATPVEGGFKDTDLLA
ncbi:kininogen-1 isoform X2 [Xyrichtys novacula]|uniref:Kininogen-1 isoform X2 n=1 Tax=Xyrichtys novacula TaxID=13765 RepID=A0AAV1FIX1_XYRNO|nr:kininogen-1 isoform X2 [Xyrichtys novacula]